jgi:F-type H+-transporting ATPase subunit b
MRRLAPLAVSLLSLPAAAMAQGMPQLDFKNPLTTTQVIWGAIIFIVFYILLSRWGLPQVGGVLEMRAATIARDLDAARGAKETADGAVAELNEAIRSAQVGAQTEISRAADAAKQSAAAQAARLNERLQAQLASAEQQIAAARTAALGALRQVATETAAVLIGRLTGSAADPQALDSAVGAELAARGQG